ncbi:RraA family protein [Alicyclobacillus dauci]|uniref:Uncharacterized protein n=1 Tax=Alicyclobacillus dauci TaxID=1475485 RepID=A0ABY6YYH4_9BACL|nr:hypothetical protein [Alicyclobacillus dauci]WAH35682.1 hypothetical protein NZD86_15555 [Alicyclobacillus dauci]
MSSVIVTQIERADAELIEALKSFGAATVHESMRRTGLVSPVLRPIYDAAVWSGLR